MKRRRAPVARRGITLFEGIAGLAVLGAALVVVQRTTRAVDRQWGLAAQERVAAEALDNALEEIAAIDWEGLDAAEAPPLGERAARALADAAWTLDVTPDDNPVASKRIRLTLSWRPTPGAAAIERRLSTYVFTPPGGDR